MRTVNGKRVLLHVAFWLAYMVEDVALVYLWDKAMPSALSDRHQLALAILNSLASMVPRLLFVYFVLYYNLPKLLAGKGGRRKYIAQLVLAFIAAVFLYRAVGVYFISPVIYGQGFTRFAAYFSGRFFLQMGMDLGFAAGVAIMVKLIRLQLTAKEREQELVRDKLETELKFLRNQTNPHFLFNTLNNIYALARKRSDETADVVLRLSKLLRFMLYETKCKQIRISDELKILDDYIALENLRYNDRLTLSFVREIDNENEPIAPLLLIPFVENAFKHGASESRFESFINLEMALQNGILEFSIENSKEENGRLVHDEKIGLSNVRRQLELLYREHEVSIRSEAAVFKVFLKINLRRYANL